MRRSPKVTPSALTRRQALTGTAAAGVALALGRSAVASAKDRIVAALPGTKVCLLTPEAVQGPFYFDPKLVRADIADGKPGARLTLTLKVVEAKDCANAESARVDVWQCDGLGVYSGYAGQETGSTKGETFLRGTQFTGADGQVQFTTIYPGWYPGRTPHVHFKVFLDTSTLVTGQLYFPDPLTEHIYATLSPYRERKAERDTMNANDVIFRRQGGADTLCKVTEEGSSHVASLVIGIDRGGSPTRS